jgi:hypothetical protein
MTNYGKEMMQTVMRLKKDAENQKQIDDLKEMIASMQNEKGDTSQKIQKLKWLGKPEQFCYIFSELAKHGYIEIPSTNGESSYAKFAKVCFELFDFKNKTTEANLKRAFYPEKNRLSDSNRKKITIPELSDIS